MGSEDEIAEKISLVIKKIYDSPVFYELKRNAQVCFYCLNCYTLIVFNKFELFKNRVAQKVSFTSEINMF